MVEQVGQVLQESVKDFRLIAYGSYVRISKCVIAGSIESHVPLGDLFVGFFDSLFGMFLTLCFGVRIELILDSTDRSIVDSVT